MRIETLNIAQEIVKQITFLSNETKLPLDFYYTKLEAFLLLQECLSSRLAFSGSICRSIEFLRPRNRIFKVDTYKVIPK